MRAKLAFGSKYLILALLALITTLSILAAPADNGLATVEYRLLLAGRLGSKTPYHERQVTDAHAEPEVCHEHAECKPIHLYKIVRHGTRYPTEKHIKKMRKLETILEWEVRFQEQDAGLLARTGEEELFEMGRRTRQRFHELFHNFTYHPLRFEFRSSQVTRALQSASAFGHGLFHDDGDERPYEHIAIVSETKSLDRLLRFHKACPAYIKGVKKNSTLKVNSDPARIGAQIYPRIFESIMLRVESLANSDQILSSLKSIGAEGTVSVVWDICMMEYAVYQQVSPYCELLGEDDIELLEYLDDVSSFWAKGYGYPINYQMSCLLFADMLETTVKAANDKNSNDDSKRLATFRFAHAETVIPLVARLGLFKDQDGSEQYRSPRELDISAVKSRKWRTGSVVPFAGNIALALYSCRETQKEAPTPETLMVELLHNEHPVHLPPELCPGNSHLTSTLCPLPVFQKAVEHIVENCDFDAMCNL